MPLLKNETVLQQSRNRKDLRNMARVYAASPEPPDQLVLYKYLDSREFLNRLNTEAEYMRFPARSLDVASVIQTLMERNSPAARGTLVNLTQSTGFQSYDPLVELLIRALAADIPASARTVAYWDQHSQPDSGYAHLVVQVLFINRSEPALKLFETKMNDPRHTDESKEVWLRVNLLPKRNDVLVLQACERMIIGRTVIESWHEGILEVLFDFDQSWYLSCRKPRPPLRVLAPDDSKEVLGRIGKHALTKMELSIPGLELKIKMAMKEIGYDWEEESGARTA
jgi:hypothetical protein